MGRKHCRKRRICSLRAISHFPTVFSKHLYCRHVKPGLVWERVYGDVISLPDDKILGLPKFKACADDKLNVTYNIKVVFRRIENIVGKEENVSYQHFLLFPQCFQNTFFLQRVKSRNCAVRG